ncbi:hypothetical protein L2E82_02565 [Cichorium intybus]|uniref:Uncharacterized protein n=1 Tax=Cichorium intybus TaxID=13427 RepID=A0ACB9H3A5_CICIN|nr:hypothetical protein L2E82_02565 [Cichorium intybus]
MDVVSPPCPSTPQWDYEKPFLTGQFHQVSVLSPYIFMKGYGGDLSKANLKANMLAGSSYNHTDFYSMVNAVSLTLCRRKLHQRGANRNAISDMDGAISDQAIGSMKHKSIKLLIILRFMLKTSNSFASWKETVIELTGYQEETNSQLSWSIAFFFPGIALSIITVRFYTPEVIFCCSKYLIPCIGFI